MKADLFQCYGHCCVFQIRWHIECSTFTASSFRIWNSSTGIPSPPLVMLPKAHLTSHSRMSGSRWLITPSWSSGSWRSFLHSSSVYSCHLFLILSAIFFQQHKRRLHMDTTRWQNTKTRLILFFAAKNGDTLYSQQKQDQELTVAQIMNSLLPNSDLNWRK